MSTDALTLSADPSRLTPTALRDVCHRAGVPAPDDSGPLRYAVIGTIDGTLPLTVAATDPASLVWTWDPHPQRLEFTRRRRDEGRITNLVVHERRSLPNRFADEQIDIITVDGLLDSSTDEERDAIGEFVVENLRPGGLLCLTYRTTIGWQEIVPLVNVMRHVASTYRGDPTHVAAHVLELLERLVDAEPAYLSRRPRAAAWVASLFATDLALVESRYLRDPLRPLSYPQVASFARRLGCDFLGDAAGRSTPLPDALAALVEAAPTPALRETYRDLATRCSHRSDVFRLGVN